MTAHEASSSSSFKSKLWNYDVFLSFSGEDTRKGFTGYLHAALEAKGYQAYMDEDDLERGEEIKKELYRGIEESKISMIVFSTKYADSSWCLDELVKIMECRSKLERHVLPIFYHVVPSDVRKQKGDLAGAFQKHEEGISAEKDDKEREAKRERVKQWRKALTEAADLGGYTITGDRREAELIKEIVDKFILKWLPRTDSLHVANHQVGINSRIKDIITYLSSDGSDDVLMVGIWGMGGLGKTTAAKAIFNKIHHKFQFKCFLADVRDITSKHGLAYLQQKLIFDILKQKFEISSDVEGIGRIKDQFSHRKVLVVIDNIDKKEQLDAIAGNHDWFGPKSRIIITTRDERLLLNVDKVYSAQKLKDGEDLKLFSWHAFGNSWPDEGFLELSEKFVSYCDGLPLALKVLGSFLVKRPIAEWKCELKKLKTTPEGEIIDPLRMSFEGLDDTQKAIFLDISCFFIGEDKDYVAKVLDECDFFATIGISVLCERCLVTVERNKLNMHDLLREMARIIISKKSPRQPEKWSRLWIPQDVTNVLTKKLGTEEVEGLALHFPYPNKSSCFSTKAFAHMNKLRLLDLDNVELNGKYKHLPKELIWLRWKYCPLESIPNDFFNQDKLVFLEMISSDLVKVWEGSKSLQNLKVINLSNSNSLIKSPDFSQVPNLEELILDGCVSLLEIHPSIGNLTRLSLVNLEGCHKLVSLPRDFYKSKSVETLLLNDCYQFRELHEDLGEMESLRVLQADKTSIGQLPHTTVRLKKLTHLSIMAAPCDERSYAYGLPSFSGDRITKIHIIRHTMGALNDDGIPKDLGSLISLQYLDLGGNDFHTLPSFSGLSKLETLWLSKCEFLHTIPDLPTNLKFLDANGCPALETMPNFSEMTNMRELHVRDSCKLTEIPGLDKSLNSMTLIHMNNCTNLTADFKKNILQGWTSCGLGGIFLHCSYVPDWFEFVNDGNKVSFDIPPSDDRNFEGLTMFCISQFSTNLAITIINNTKHTKLRETITGSDACDYLWQGHISNDKLNLQSGDKVDVIFGDMDYRDRMKRTGVNLVWDKPVK